MENSGASSVPKATSSWRHRLATPIGVGLIAASAWLVYGLVGLHSHGVTSDSPALFYAGDRTLFWLEHPAVPDALNFNGPEPRGFYSRFGRTPNPQDPIHYPVLPGFVTAVTSQIFHDGLGWLDDIDAHQLGLVLLHAVALFLYGYFLHGLLGFSGALAGSLALVFFPCIAGHAFNNAKDLACVDFYGCGIAAAGVGVVHKRGRALLASGLLLGLSLACKMNGVFALVSLVLWTPIAFWLLYRKVSAIPPAVALTYPVIPYLAVIVFFVLWPWLYQGRVSDWWAHLSEYVRWMLSYGDGRRPTWTDYSLRCLFFTTPPAVLVSAALYLGTGWRGGPKSKSVFWLLLIWTGLPIFRISVPHSGFFDANRHFMEYVPGLCALAGGGFAWLLKAAANLLKRWASPKVGDLHGWTWAGLSLLGLGSLLFSILSYAPFEIAYFNVFIGGLGGAQRTALFRMAPPHIGWVNGTEGDYWGSSLRFFQRWVHQTQPAPTSIGICGAGSFDANWDGPPTYHLTEPDKAEVVFVQPRETFCNWRRVRQLESTRPLIQRVERGGGLIYELLGPPTGKVGPPLSPPSRYNQQS